MTELAILNIADGMPSNPVLLRGLSLESLVWHSSGWIGRKDRGIGWFKEFVTVHSGAHFTGDASEEIEEKCWLNLAARDSALSGKKDQLEIGGGTTAFRAFHSVVGWTFPDIRWEKWALLEARSRVATLLQSLLYASQSFADLVALNCHSDLSLLSI